MRERSVPAQAMVPKGGLDHVGLGGPRHLLRSKLLANATQLSSGGIGQMQGGAASDVGAQSRRPTTRIQFFYFHGGSPRERCAVGERGSRPRGLEPPRAPPPPSSPKCRPPPFPSWR